MFLITSGGLPPGPRCGKGGGGFGTGRAGRPGPPRGLGCGDRRRTPVSHNGGHIPPPVFDSENTNNRAAGGRATRRVSMTQQSSRHDLTSAGASDRDAMIQWHRPDRLDEHSGHDSWAGIRGELNDHRNSQDP